MKPLGPNPLWQMTPQIPDAVEPMPFAEVSEMLHGRDIGEGLVALRQTSPEYRWPYLWRMGLLDTPTNRKKEELPGLDGYLLEFGYGHFPNEHRDDVIRIRHHTAELAEQYLRDHPELSSIFKRELKDFTQGMGLSLSLRLAPNGQRTRVIEKLLDVLGPDAPTSPKIFVLTVVSQCLAAGNLNWTPWLSARLQKIFSEDTEPVIQMRAWKIIAKALGANNTALKQIAAENDFIRENYRSVEGQEYFFFDPLERLALKGVWEYLGTRDLLVQSPNKMDIDDIRPIHSLADDDPARKPEDSIVARKEQQMLGLMETHAANFIEAMRTYCAGDRPNENMWVLYLSSMDEFYLIQGHHRFQALLNLEKKGLLPKTWRRCFRPRQAYHVGPWPDKVLKYFLTGSMSLSWK